MYLAVTRGDLDLFLFLISDINSEPRAQSSCLYVYEHSEQARAPHTNGPRDVPRCGALSLLQKKRCTTRGGDGGAQAIVRGGARCVSQVLHRCAQTVSRGAARCASQVNDRGAHADAEAPRMYLIVVYRPFPAAPLVVRCIYMAVVPGPMLAAVVSRCCRRRLQQLVCACGS